MEPVSPAATDAAGTSSAKGFVHTSVRRNSSAGALSPAGQVVRRVTAFLLARREAWEVPFTVVTLLCGTIPILSFWAEHRATRRVRAEAAADALEPDPTV